MLKLWYLGVFCIHPVPELLLERVPVPVLVPVHREKLGREDDTFHHETTCLSVRSTFTSTHVQILIHCETMRQPVFLSDQVSQQLMYRYLYIVTVGDGKQRAA